MQVVVNTMEPALDLMILYMLVQFSKPYGIRQFDKVCKKKFLMYMQEIQEDDEVRSQAVRINLSRYMLRLEATERHKQKSSPNFQDS